VGDYGVTCVRNGSGRAEKWTSVSPWSHLHELAHHGGGGLHGVGGAGDEALGVHLAHAVHDDARARVVHQPLHRAPALADDQPLRPRARYALPVRPNQSNASFSIWRSKWGVYCRVLIVKTWNIKPYINIFTRD